MLNFPKWKVVLILLVCLSSIFASIPSFLDKDNLSKLPSFFRNNTINLGLDLRGGSHLLLEVDFANYLLEQSDILKDSIKKEFRSNKLSYTTLRSQNGKVVLTLKNINDISQAKKLLGKISNDLEIEQKNEQFIINYHSNFEKILKEKVIEQSIEIIRRRVDEAGTKEPTIQKQGTNYILLQVPGLENPEHLKNLLGQTAKLTFHIVNHDASPEDYQIPFGNIIVKDENGNKFVLFKKTILTGDLLQDARASFNDKNEPVVSFNFNNLGAKKFAEITSQNTGKALAIVLDNKVISAPVIDEPIIGGSGMIRGNFTVKTANDLALLLRAGALPAPLHIVEERTVGPSLGSDSIKAGRLASLIGIISVMAFMLATYGLLGLFANIALIFNMLFIVSVLAFIQATLTMPGIAGIVLTMGMAVDANVLIFERIREEARLGLSPFATVDRGFNQAFSTILDSNLTTIIAALLLYLFGSGAVKGFAVTLIIGIICSMFSAITLTRCMIVFWIKTSKPKVINI